MNEQNSNSNFLFLNGDLKDNTLKRIRDDRQFSQVKDYLESLYFKLKSYLPYKLGEFSQKLKDQTEDGQCLGLFTELKIAEVFCTLIANDNKCKMVELSNNIKNDVNADICIEKCDYSSRIYIEVTRLSSKHFTPVYNTEDLQYEAKEVFVRIREQIASAIKRKYEQHSGKIGDNDIYIIAIDFCEYKNLLHYSFVPPLIQSIAFQLSNPDEMVVSEFYDDSSNPVLDIKEKGKINKLRIEDGYKSFSFNLYEDYPKLSGILLSCNNTLCEDIVFSYLPGNSDYAFLLRNGIDRSKFPNFIEIMEQTNDQWSSRHFMDYRRH